MPQLAPAIVLSSFVLIGNPIIVMVIMGLMGYRKRTSFLAGLTVAQISEFSLVLGALGVSLGHLGPEAMALITCVGLITIGLSTYLILYSHPIYERLAPVLSVFERSVPHREQSADSAESQGADFILFGLGRYGNNLAQSLRRQGWSVHGVDFDPQVISRWHSHGHAAQYGDAEDPEFAASLPLTSARWVVCTAPRRETNLILLRALREYGYQGRIALTAHHSQDASALQQGGADLVLTPFVDAAKEAAEALVAASNGRSQEPGRQENPPATPSADSPERPFEAADHAPRTRAR